MAQAPLLQFVVQFVVLLLQKGNARNSNYNEALQGTDSQHGVQF